MFEDDGFGGRGAGHAVQEIEQGDGVEGAGRRDGVERGRHVVEDAFGRLGARAQAGRRRDEAVGVQVDEADGDGGGDAGVLEIIARADADVEVAVGADVRAEEGHEDVAGRAAPGVGADDGEDPPVVEFEEGRGVDCGAGRGGGFSGVGQGVGPGRGFLVVDHFGG